MCWLTTHSVAVATYRSTIAATRRQTASRVMFQISLTSSNATSVLVERPLAAFHVLRDDLLRLTRAPPPPIKGPRWMRRVFQKSTKTSACACESSSAPCPFHKLHIAIASLPPLPSCESTLRRFQSQRMSLDDSRVAIDVWLRALHALFTEGFSGALLESKYQREDCAVLNAYAAFLDAKNHFPVVSTAVMRQPLALRAWRAERDKVSVEDISLLEEDDDDWANEEDEMLSTVSKPTVSTETMTTETALDATSRLPRLEVKRLGLATLQTFLEDFCDTILAQHGQDIAELQSPNLTMARRWEIGLYVACRIGHSYGAQLILFYYADANVEMEDGTTCLHIAARMGRSSIVALLLQEGADANQSNDAGITPLIAACRNGCLDIAKMLLDAGAEVDATSERGTQAIHAAVVSESQEVVQLLLDAGANVRATTSSGLTPLHFAARVGSVELSELLLKHNADPGQQTKGGSDAIMIATTNGHMEICELFQKEMDRKNVFSSSGGKLFHRFKKTASAVRASETVAAMRPYEYRHRSETQEDANSVILMNELANSRVVRV